MTPKPISFVLDFKSRGTGLTKDQKLVNAYIELVNANKQLMLKRPGVTFYKQMPIV